MNFRSLFPLLLLLSSCGVKGPPRPPADTQVPAYTDSYLLKAAQSTDQSSSSKNDKDKEEKKEE